MAPLVLLAAGDTDAGRVRKQNEDHILVRPELGLFAIADGVGGHQRGEVASALSVASMKGFFDATHRVRDEATSERVDVTTGARRLGAAVRRANRSVWEMASVSDRFREMASTIVAAYFAHETQLLHIAHVGDSRCYRLRNGTLELLTHDHSLRNEALARRPALSAEQVAVHSPSVLTRALGMNATVSVDQRTEQPHAGDAYVLCSDGLTDMIDEVTLRDAVLGSPLPEQASRTLVELANASGGADNVAVVVLRFIGRGSSGRERTRTRTRRLGDSTPDIVVHYSPSGATDSVGALAVEAETSARESSSEIVVVVASENGTLPGVPAADDALSRTHRGSESERARRPSGKPSSKLGVKATTRNKRGG